MIIHWYVRVLSMFRNFCLISDAVLRYLVLISTAGFAASINKIQPPLKVFVSGPAKKYDRTFRWNFYHENKIVARRMGAA